MGGCMGEQGVLPAVRATIERVSGGAIAIFGLALALFAYESSRMSAFQNVQAQTTLLDLTPSAAIIFAIVALLIGYEKHPTLRIHRHPLAGFALAALFALSSLALARNGFIVPQNDWVSFLARCARNISVILMLACWMEATLPKRARDVGIVLALAIIALAGLNVLSALFKEGAAHILVAVVPFLSMACLYWYKDHEVLEQSSSIASADAYAALKVDTALMPESVTGATIASTLLNFLIPLGCYSFVFGYMHYAWIPTQDGTVASLAIQLAAALGTLIAGIVLLCLVATFWGRRKIELYNFFALSIMVLALCITALASDRFTFIYVVPLNIAQKIAMFFIWMAPFLVPHRRSAMTSWCWALLLYQAGKLASSSASSFIDQDTYLVLALAFAGLLIIGSMQRGKPPLRKATPFALASASCSRKATQRTARRRKTALNALAWTDMHGKARLTAAKRPAKTRRAHASTFKAAARTSARRETNDRPLSFRARTSRKPTSSRAAKKRCFNCFPKA